MSRNDEEKRRVSGRHIGSLVADFHRNLMYGGVFLYPTDRRSPKGKLRLMYEANPLSFIAQEAGGYGSDGKRAILEITPEELHHRTGLVIGNEAEVKLAESCVARSS
jgi:fructose-1,6-bisphosphatase I